MQSLLAPQDLKWQLPDIKPLQPYFDWLGKDWIQDTLDKTSQSYHAIKHYPFQKHFKSHFLATNVHHLNKEYAMDTLFMDVPSCDDGIGGHAGCTMVQLFTGCRILGLTAFNSSSSMCQ